MITGWSYFFQFTVLNSYPFFKIPGCVLCKESTKSISSVHLQFPISIFSILLISGDTICRSSHQSTLPKSEQPCFFEAFPKNEKLDSSRYAFTWSSILARSRLGYHIQLVYPRDHLTLGFLVIIMAGFFCEIIIETL